MNKILLLIICLLAATYGYSQVGVYKENPHSSAILDMDGSVKKGVALPRMTTAQKTAITNPANGLAVYDTDKKCLSQNIGTEASPNWICLTKDETRFFYMPSINIPTTTVGATILTLNLYDLYKSQFGTPVAKNATASSGIPYYASASDLHYYVTYYDNSVMNITGISDAGIMSYTISQKANLDTYMNVVFVVK